MQTSTRETADFAEMHGAMQAATGAVADSAGRQLFGG
jgi:hypothetical protein